MGDFWEFVEAAWDYWGSAVITLSVAAFIVVINFLYEKGSGSEGLPWYVSVIIFLLFSPFIGYRLWLDQRHVHRKEAQNLKDSHQETEDALHQQVADLKARLDKGTLQRLLEETLVSYSREARQMLKNYETTEHQSGVPAKKWAKKVRSYLEENVGPSYADQFENDDGFPVHFSLGPSGAMSAENEKVRSYLSKRISRLDSITREVRN